MTPDEIIEVLQGVKAGRKWGWKSHFSEKLTENEDQSTLAVARSIATGYRVALVPLPDEITLPARTIPAPLREAPKVGDTYYLPNACNDNWFDSQRWDGDSYDLIALKNGQCYSTAERAIAAAKAQVPYES